MGTGLSGFISPTLSLWGTPNCIKLGWLHFRIEYTSSTMDLVYDSRNIFFELHSPRIRNDTVVVCLHGNRHLKLYDVYYHTILTITYCICRHKVDPTNLQQQDNYSMTINFVHHNSLFIYSQCK